MIGPYGELDDRQIDALREMGNIGAGNAATSLSEMAGDTVLIGVPNVMVSGREGAASLAGGPAGTCVAVTIGFDGDLRGALLFIIGCEDAKGLAGLFAEGLGLGEGVGDAEGLGDGDGGCPGAISEMQLSAIVETGNIVGSSYLCTVAALTGFRLAVSTPQVSIDEAGASLGAAISGFSPGNDVILIIDGGFQADTRRLGARVALFMDAPSLGRALDRLGAD